MMTIRKKLGLYDGKVAVKKSMDASSAFHGSRILTPKSKKKSWFLVLLRPF